ncbi:unnamed protein product [Arabidopsis lyrata]|nr:unnamed protein product [Arabidopsis lyrata]
MEFLQGNFVEHLVCIPKCFRRTLVYSGFVHREDYCNLHNCPPLRRSEIEYYAMLAKVGVHHYGINRHFGETNMNVHSSRSHTIFRMVIESRGKDNSFSDAIRVSGGGRSFARETIGRVAPELWQENFEAICRI